MRLVVDVPDNFYNFFQAKELEKEIALNNALMLFMQEKVSVSLAAELAGLNLYDFIFYCNQNNIPVYNLLPEDIENELRNFNN